jgi:hypothetical protein
MKPSGYPVAVQIRPGLYDKSFFDLLKNDIIRITNAFMA